MPRVVACIPSIRAERALPTLLGVLSQSRPPDAILVHDESLDGILATLLMENLVIYGGIEVLRHGTIAHGGVSSGYSKVAASRTYLARQSTLYHPDWLWFVDDDVFPMGTCLERLLESVRGTDHVMASATLVNLLPQAAGKGAIRLPPRNHVRREHDTVIPTCSGDCFLARPGDVQDLPDVPVANGGEDLVRSAYVTVKWGSIVHSAAAIALHLRDEPSSWTSSPATVEEIYPYLFKISDHHLDARRILASQGEPL